MGQRSWEQPLSYSIPWAESQLGVTGRRKAGADRETTRRLVGFVSLRAEGRPGRPPATAARHHCALRPGGRSCMASLAAHALPSTLFPGVAGPRADGCFLAASVQATGLESPSSFLRRGAWVPRIPVPVEDCSVQIALPPRRENGGATRRRHVPAALVSRGYGGARSYDPELRLVLELATDEELYELEDILFGPRQVILQSSIFDSGKVHAPNERRVADGGLGKRAALFPSPVLPHFGRPGGAPPGRRCTNYFSPLLKSITGRPDVDYILDFEDVESRESFIELLESRFLFLAADARSTLRGWRPSYRDVLLRVRRKLGVPCAGRLPTEDLEVEIFLHLLNENSSKSQISGLFCNLNSFGVSSNQASLEVGHNKWKVDVLAAVNVGAKEFQQMVLKGGGILTVAKLYQLLARKLSGKVIMEAANYQIKNEMIKRGGQFAALSLESRTALLAARQGFARAASRYLGFRSVMMLLGPVSSRSYIASFVGSALDWNLKGAC
ncbi:hypothetical protein Taro_033019 [Colocasia esculenta]|uniref:Uncharacterized protein n=1 Tax=Colocasia esculenta TaxID=4460 RepID=A0A843W0K3_COLES|nr:hypothetical protein [Colocasia esculenta]